MQANQAVRANNEEIIARNESSPAAGGNIAKMNQQLGGGRAVQAYEASFYGYKGHNAEELLAILMVRDFDNSGGSPLLDSNMDSVGISLKGHPRCTNTIQLIYSMGVVNQMY